METTIDTAPLKEIQKFIWSQGDPSKLADAMPAAEALVAAAGARPGDRVLDVGAGTGKPPSPPLGSAPASPRRT